jgi:hypothetical protein
VKRAAGHGDAEGVGEVVRQPVHETRGYSRYQKSGTILIRGSGAGIPDIERV